jgi:hypothetical protein
MRDRIISHFTMFLFLLTGLAGFSQVPGSEMAAGNTIPDSVKKDVIIFDTTLARPEINLSIDQAIDFLEKMCNPYLWKNTDDPFRTALERLIFEASNPRFDSVEYFLKRYPYDSINIPWERFFKWRPLEIKAGSPVSDSSDLNLRSDSVINDTLGQNTVARNNLRIESSGDTVVLIIADTLQYVNSSSPFFPFRYYRHPFQSDSISTAATVLMDFLESRDSTVLYFTGITGREVPVWLNSKSDRVVRFWLKNDFNDSVTVWIGNHDRNKVGLFLENGVSFRRPAMQKNIAGTSVNVKEVDRSKLLDIKKIITKPQYWKTRTESLFGLNQGSLSNWAKGGESSVSGSLDITSFFDYSNKSLLLSSSNFVRLKYGLIGTSEEGAVKVVKNVDLLETNSKLNHKAFGKFDFSAVMLFKTQISKGYVYPNDSVPVSKFMNPAILTVGLGLDYKPNKQTSINFSPFSYKGTFVPDTSIDQTKYGIPADKRSLNEPGASFMISNEFKPVKTVVITNRLQLFTNYIHNPLNIDVDWEMMLAINLNWFTDLRLNTHLIFDDDTKTPVYDREKNPVLGPDGLQKKSARIQFKEMLGVSLAFRF